MTFTPIQTYNIRCNLVGNTFFQQVVPENELLGSLSAVVEVKTVFLVVVVVVTESRNLQYFRLE